VQIESSIPFRQWELALQFDNVCFQGGPPHSERQKRPV